MRTLSQDTDPDIEDRLIEGYRQMSAAEKFRCMTELVQFARHMGLQDLRRRYPMADEHELRMRLASRWLDAELMRRAYSWDPDLEGF